MAPRLQHSLKESRVVLEFLDRVSFTFILTNSQRWKCDSVARQLLFGSYYKTGKTIYRVMQLWSLIAR
jgi:hypothetical protein